jgi:VanZ family protein
VVVWIAVILAVSTELGTAEASRTLLEPLFRWLNPTITPDEIYRWNIITRKAAHFCEFAMLAVLIWRTRDFLTNPWQPSIYQGNALRTLAIAALIAAASELVQVFTSTRSATFADVFRNIGGAVLGVGAVLAFKALRRPRRAVTDQGIS